MSTVIIYKSNTGFTKEYAELLERRLVDATIYPLEKLNKKIIKDADHIFYGGPLRNNVILGLNKFLKNYELMENKNIYVFAVGIQPLDQEKRENVICANGLEFYHVRLYFLQGGMNISKMNPIQRKMLMMGLKIAGKKENNVDIEMIKTRLSQPISFVSSSNLDRMVEIYHKIKITK